MLSLSNLWSHKLPMESFSSLHLEPSNSYKGTQHGPQKVLPCHLWKILLLLGWALSHRNVCCLWGGQVTLLSPRFPVCFCQSGSGNIAEVFPHSALLGSSQKTGEKPGRWGWHCRGEWGHYPCCCRGCSHLLEEEVKCWQELREKLFGSGISSRSCR